MFITALIAVLALFALPILAASSALIFAEITLVASLTNFINIAIELVFVDNITIDFEAGFAALGLLGSLTSLVVISTITASVLPVIGVLGFAYWLSSRG